MTTSDAAAQPPSHDSSLVSRSAASGTLIPVGQVANQYAARNVIADYLSRNADNTTRRQAADLQRFANFLNAVGTVPGLELRASLASFARDVAAFPDGFPPDPEAWRGVTWGLVEGFRNWMVSEGDAVGSINVRLSTVKAYAKLATK